MKTTTATTEATEETRTTTTGTTEPPPPLGEPCPIPDGATVIDFDAWDRSMGDTEAISGDLQNAILDDGHELFARQWDRYEFPAYPPDDDNPALFLRPRVNSIGYIIDNPARDLWTTSPPMVMRLIDDTVWTLMSGWDPGLQGQLDYFGFNVGFGHFGEGFETPEELVVELRVAVMPMHMSDGTVLDQGAWETVSITLGPGPQPVTHCLMATNTAGRSDRYSVHLIDILPRTLDGTPVHIPVDIDDVFYGVNEPVTPPFLLDELPGAAVTTTITLPEPVPEVTLPTIPEPIEPLPDPSDLPWRVLFALGGLFIGVGAMWALRRN